MSCQMKAIMAGSIASSRHTVLGFPAILAVSEHATTASMSRVTTSSHLRRDGIHPASNELVNYSGFPA